MGCVCAQIEFPEQRLHSVVRGYTLPSGPLVDQSPRVRLYIPVQYLYKLIRPDVVVYQVEAG